MQLLTFFLAALLLVSAFVVEAKNCSVKEIYEVLQPIKSDANFATCQSNTNYSLLSFTGLSANQSAAFCASSACQTLLTTTLSSGFLPDCRVPIGAHSLNLTEVITIAAKCNEASTLDERAVEKEGDEDKLGHTTDNIVTIVGHSVPMDEIKPPRAALGLLGTGEAMLNMLFRG